MIASAAEFVALRCSEVPGEYLRAAHEEAPLEVWLEVIRDYPDMRRWAVLNKTIPVEVLGLLLRDPSEDVRWSVAMKRKLPVEMQRILAEDGNSSVRHCLCWNAKVDTAILLSLCDDREQFVREAARERYALRTAA